MNFGQFVCKAYGEGKTSRPADVTDLGYQIVSGGGRKLLCSFPVTTSCGIRTESKQTNQSLKSPLAFSAGEKLSTVACAFNM